MDLPFKEFGNSPDELHALLHGLYNGYYRTHEPGSIPQRTDVINELPYYKFGYVVGRIVRKI